MSELRSRAAGLVSIVRWLGWLAVVEVRLRSGLPQVCGWLRLPVDLESAAAPVPGVWPVPRRYGRQARALLQATSVWPFGDTCLRRCLLLGHLLRSEAPVLRIGVRVGPAGEVAAHSWLEVGGQTLDPGARDFAVLHAAGRRQP